MIRARHVNPAVVGTALVGLLTVAEVRCDRFMREHPFEVEREARPADGRRPDRQP